jgi:hypothetical protein
MLQSYEEEDFLLGATASVVPLPLVSFYVVNVFI